jgi:hypothetical protein
MTANDQPPPRWKKLSAALRRAGVAKRPAGEDLSAPHGFATRVVARVQADGRADAAGLALWRRWSLTGAACALLVFGGSFLVPTPEAPVQPIIPVPTLDDDLPELANR